MSLEVNFDLRFYGKSEKEVSQQKAELRWILMNMEKYKKTDKFEKWKKKYFNWLEAHPDIKRQMSFQIAENLVRIFSDPANDEEVKRWVEDKTDHKRLNEAAIKILRMRMGGNIHES